MCLKQSCSCSLLATVSISHANRRKAPVCNSCPACFPDSLPVTVVIDSSTPVTLIRDNQPLTENGWMDVTFCLSPHTQQQVFPPSYTRGAVVYHWEDVTRITKTGTALIHTLQHLW